MKKVILAGICLRSQQKSFASSMEECERLCEACGYEIVEKLTQTSDSIDRNTAFRKGKIEELRLLVENTDAQLVVFFNSLTVQMAHRISEQIGINVIDRTSLILDIFAYRARSRQAKLQVEMARLQYALPKAVSEGGSEERSRGGGVKNRGAGEMRSSVIARTYRNRIAELKKELAEIENRRNRDERRRSKTLLKRVALIGYTNAGKSSLMNSILQECAQNGNHVEAVDMLFATLDTSVRSIQYRGYGFLLYDTVGFVSDLPDPLLKAFHSTLSSAVEADLLVHVIDVSDPDGQHKIRAVEDTLQQIHAQDIPVVRVGNKVDIGDASADFCRLKTSCVNHTGITQLLDAIIEKLYPEEETCAVFLPYDKIGMFDEYRKVCAITVQKHLEDGMKIIVSGPREYVQAFRMYRI